jgi:FlaA1/EpsC-like NDP-sugar epimerase
MSLTKDSWRISLAGRLPRLAVSMHDLLVTWVCWQALHHVRYAMLPVPPDYPLISFEVAIVLLAQGFVFRLVGLYQGLWRFASVPDLINILKSAVLGVLAITLGLGLYNRLDGVPRTVLALYPFALMGGLGLPRLIYRAWKDHQLGEVRGASAQRVLILGAGQAGEALLRDLLRNGSYQPVGFLDDARELHGTRVHGVRVLGGLDDANRVAKESAAKMLVIAMPSLDASSMQRVLAICEGTGLPFRKVPRLVDVLEGRSMPGALEEVAIDDLLGRKPITPDWKLIRGWLGGRSVLVTGAGGSIGSELCRQCARHGATKIALLEISEYSLLKAQADLHRAFPDVEIVPILGNCGDPALARRALELVQPDAVFHAAAYKQVPLLEAQLREAVRNNALASETMIKASKAAGVGTFVLISTDKAVDPANILGATKRLAEMVCQSADDLTSTRFVTVRFGNVLDSVGSVVPLFREQIRAGGPVTVTDPDVTRYFMTIPEACQLIVQAAASAAHASIYTLDMGEPIAIRVLAEQMIRLAGKQPGRDIAIVYTGLRPGEKLHETLFHEEEAYRPTSHPKILQARAREVSADALSKALVLLRQAVIDYDEDQIWRLLKTTVPEFSPDNPHESTDTIVQFPTREARNSR